MSKLDEAMEELRTRRRSRRTVLPAVDDVLAAYDAERASKGEPSGNPGQFAKQCEPWCGHWDAIRSVTRRCSTECSYLGSPANPMVTP